MKHSAIQERSVLGKCFCCMILVLLTAPYIVPDDAAAQNDKPIAVIDGTLNIERGQSVYLNGNLSSDPNGDRLSYKWTLVSAPEGSTAQVGTEKDNASFSAYAWTAGKYVIKLVVNDGYEDSEPAYATINVYEKH